MVLGDAVSKLETFVCNLVPLNQGKGPGNEVGLYGYFEPYFKVHNLVNVHPKSIILGQMTNLNMLFYVIVSDYRLIKI